MRSPVLPLIAGLLLLGAGTAPTLAASCNGEGSGPGLSIGLGFHFGEDYTEEEDTDLVLMQLRQAGVDATRVERWGGCYRAFVRDGNGHQHMEFFNARTLAPVD